MSDAPEDWRDKVTFADRVANVTKISDAVKTQDPNIDGAEAHRLARETERNISATSHSKVEYEEKCTLAAAIQAQPEDPSTVEDSTHSEKPLSPIAITIGKYKARHHRDGLFSEVFEARNYHADGPELVALKVTTPSMMQPPHDSEREARIVREAACRNVVPLLETFQVAGGKFVLVFEFMQIDLETFLASKSEYGGRKQALVESHLRDLFAALAFIHSKGIIHRDVKPSNILLANPQGPAYLADFGIAWSPNDAASEDKSAKITDVGTTCYRPPELLFGQRAYGTSLDLWAAGCVVAEAVSTNGQTLFNAGDLGSELALIQSIFRTLGTPTLETWPEAAKLPDWGKMQFKEFPAMTWEEILPNTTKAARNLVSRLVRYESGDRISAVDALEHDYIRGVCGTECQE